MHHYCCVFILALIFFSDALAQEPKIRVRIKKNTPVFEVKGFDLVLNADKLHQKFSNLSKLTFDCRSKIINISDGKFKTNSSGPITLKSPSGFMNLNAYPTRDELWIWPTQSGGCEIINAMPIETYLYGVVNSEFNSKWSTESVKAQVIAARTYAHYQIQNSKNKHFDLEGSVLDQVYDGFLKEDTAAAIHVKNTKGQILSSRGKVIQTFYHSTCGGWLESSANVWGSGREPGFRSTRKRCGFCNNSPASQWETRLSSSELNLKLGVKVSRLELTTDPLSKRIDMISIWSENGNKTIMSGAKFRSTLGELKVKSTRFELEKVKDQYILKGSGLGHGVGMCQYGAKKMSELGYSALNILQNYYPKTEITRLW